MRRRLLAVAAALHLVLPGGLVAYPLNGFERSGIRRLLGYLKLQQAASGPRLPPGALLGVEAVRLHLAAANPAWDLSASPRDPELQGALESIFRNRDPSYAVAVVDITDPEAIAWAALREDRAQLPGSVGKVLCMIALFDGLRRVYPDERDRLRVLRERVVEATDWTRGDPHTVPKHDPAAGVNRFSVVAVGDRFALSEWLDHMISASANSAGAMVWKEAMLLRRFGGDYPPDPETERLFWRDTSGAELTRLSQVVIDEPLEAAGIDLEGIQQGTFWTRASSARIPGIRSFATPRELVRVLLRIEQGRMVDEWSSREMKRYLYMTKKRYRYVYAPELSQAAVYFKSGSFYQCRPEPEFTCAKYRGNATNLMNSIAIVESPAEPGPGQKRYLVALLSNVLKVNSAWDHSRVGAAIEKVVQTRRPTVVQDEGSEAEKREVGRSDG
ncbi:MAG: serine hydrolase [Thermoanaerobaculia bacterium]|nr:serine hydrolase [Thermoanaerobaculia bacterium]